MAAVAVLIAARASGAPGHGRGLWINGEADGAGRRAAAGAGGPVCRLGALRASCFHPWFAPAPAPAAPLVLQE